MDDGELLGEFVEESREHLGDIEMQLLQIEALGDGINDDLVNTVFRAIHSIKGAAGFLGLTQINDVAHRLENVLGKIREHQFVPDPYNVDVMLKAADRLRKLIKSVATSNETDNSELIAKLDALLADDRAFSPKQAASTSSKVVDDIAACHSTTGEASLEAAAETGKRGRAKSPRKPRKQNLHAGTDKTPSPKGASKRNPTKMTDELAIADEDPTRRVAEKLDEIASGLDQERDAAVTPAAVDSTIKAPASSSQSNTAQPSAEATIRVGVRVLDRLMNLAGELVLSRNQLLRALGEHSDRSTSLDAIVGGLDQVTTELQETIMQTRMQPIGNVFNKFPRVIRDLSSTLGKQISLQMEGNEVEVDKTIVEAIADPLTHLIRNSCDHGIETPSVRQASGKPECGNVLLRAFHQAGKVMIEITDDGAGMDPHRLRQKAVEKGLYSQAAADQLSDRDAVNLIFAPGFSTAAVVTAVSGRGVGMDVVRTNIEKLGGSVEVTSVHGKGSKISITLPLTLAIVPSMIVAVGDRRYALPQANIAELVRTDGVEKRIERVSSSEVLRLRGSLIPLVRLRQILGMPSDDVKDECSESQLVVVEAGRSRFALAVDRVLDSEEIVVKPLGRHLNNLPLLAGATILGDGRVAMILDAAGIVNCVKLSSDADRDDAEQSVAASVESKDDIQRLVLMSDGPKDHFAVSMDIVSRIERVPVTEIDQVGDRRVLKYRGGTLQLLAISDVVPVVSTDETEFTYVIVFRVYGHEVGLIAPHLNDIRDCSIINSMETCRQPGVAGITVIDGRSTRLLDLYGLCEIARPEWFDNKKSTDTDAQPTRILVCEDSAFFRNFLVRMLVEQGFKVTDGENGEEGWSLLTEHPTEFDIVVTDVEMPELDGLGLTRRIRADGRFNAMPIIALTSLADSDSVQRGLEAGVTEYQVKMNKPELLAGIERLTKKGRK